MSFSNFGASARPLLLARDAGNMPVILMHEQGLVSLGLHEPLQFCNGRPDVILGTGQIFVSGPIENQLDHQQKFLLNLQIWLSSGVPSGQVMERCFKV